MKNLVLVLTMVLFTTNAFAQLEFSKFTFKKDSPFGSAPTRKMTDLAFKVTGEKILKYVTIHYCGVNELNDAVSSSPNGTVNTKRVQVEAKAMLLTGPFKPKEKYKRWASATFYYPMKVTAFPLKIEITYMDGVGEEIIITKDNFKTYFPKMEWIDINYDMDYIFVNTKEE